MKTNLLLSFLLITVYAFGQTTSIPDPNFEQRLIDMGYDSGTLNGEVPTANINTITTLFVPMSNISDLTGIEDFSALELLDCSGNPLTSVDLSGNTSLITFYTGQNELSSLNVSSNMALENLTCLGTLLTTLDVSNNVNLRYLNCSNSPITNLDLSNNIALEFLGCQGNTGISSITSLNLKNGNNINLTTMFADINTDLMCIEVDDASEANSGSGVYSSWVVDASAYYSEDCSSCPEMNLIGNAITILSGDNTPDVADNTDFGIVAFGSFEERTFTLENTGDADLNLNGSPVIQITNSSDFTISSAPSTVVSANGGITNFTVRYTPSQAGTINTATLSISNDDCDDNPYTFDVKGQSEAALNLGEETINNKITIIPNPNYGVFFINHSEGISINSIEVYGLNGKNINNLNFAEFNSNTQLKFNYEPGLYILKIYFGNQSIVKKLLIH